jgi:hypothetical protein
MLHVRRVAALLVRFNLDATSQPGPTNCWWEVAGAGQGSYVVDVNSVTAGCFGPGPLDLSRIHAVSFRSSASMDISVTSIRVNPR